MTNISEVMVVVMPIKRPPHLCGGLANAFSAWITDGVSANGVTMIHWRPTGGDL